MTRLGDLDARMAWMEPTTTADGVGGQTVVWAAESYLWARVDPAGGREVLTANALHPSATHRVITWRRDDVTLRWRLRDEAAGVVRAVYGYGTTENDVPEPIRQAILLLVGHWFLQREPTSPGVLSPIPLGINALLAPYIVRHGVAV